MRAESALRTRNSYASYRLLFSDPSFSRDATERVGSCRQEELIPFLSPDGPQSHLHINGAACRLAQSVTRDRLCLSSRNAQGSPRCPPFRLQAGPLFGSLQPSSATPEDIYGAICRFIVSFIIHSTYSFGATTAAFAPSAPPATRGTAATTLRTTFVRLLGLSLTHCLGLERGFHRLCNIWVLYAYRPSFPIQIEAPFAFEG